MSYFDDLKAEHPARLAKLERDPNIVDADRQLFEAHVNGWNATGELTSHAADFCHANQLKGPPATVSVDEILGHGHERKEFLQLLISATLISKEAAEELVGYWRSLGGDVQIETVRAHVGGLDMGRYLMWSFRNPTHQFDPMDDVSNSDLACRLGLDSGVGKSYLFWGLRLPPSKVPHLPTAFDAWENLDRWDAGGYTVPNSECRHTFPTGFPEVVHWPVTFESLASAIR